MGEEQFDRVQHLFLTALELPEEQRDLWLRQQCGENSSLLVEIRSLLNHDSLSSDPLEKSLDRAIDLEQTLAGKSDSDSTAKSECTHVDDVQFLSRLADVEILSSEEICKIEREISTGNPSSDPRVLASQLVTEGKLTAFQAESLLKGKPKLLIDKYLILDLIDIGGMGTVFKAIHRPMNRIVAIKMVSKYLLASTEQVQRFLREVRVAATLEDLNVVRAYDADQFNGTHFLVMEYVRGENLAKRVARDGPLSVEHAVDCILQAANGLRYAHRRGVVHRDIKPSNLMQADDGTVKVLDLGLANVDDSFRVIQKTTNASSEYQGDEEYPDASLTQAGDLLGTASFMAPEQSHNAGLADPRSDVYSLGCTFYFLLMGQSPYRSKSVLKVLAQHRDAAIPSVRDRRPDVPPSVDAICSKMLAKDPSERFQTMGELIAAIEDCGFNHISGKTHGRKGESLSSVKIPDPSDHGAREQTRRNPSQTRLFSAIAFTFLLVCLSVAAYQLRKMFPIDDDKAFVSYSNVIRPDSNVEVGRDIFADNERSERPSIGHVEPTAKLAFVSNRDGASTLWSMNSDGTGRTRLGVLDFEIHRPDFSLDGNRVAFSFEGDIAVMDADGTNRKTLTSDPAHDSEPAWSPSGQHLAWVSKRTGAYQVWVMDSDGSHKTQLTHKSWSYVPFWSADGSRIGFTSFRDNDFEIYTMRRDGSDLNRVTRSPGRDFGGSWSINDEILFHSNRHDPSRHATEVYTINVDGTSTRSLTHHPASDGSSTWSPDGRIAFASSREGNSEIFVMNADETGLQNVSADPLTHDFNPQWIQTDSSSEKDSPIGARPDLENTSRILSTQTKGQ